MDPFERELAESLRRRAGEVPASPLGYTDVQRRIVQRRRRTATMATAAVTLPAVVGLGFLAGRNSGEERLVSEAGAFDTTTNLPMPTTTPAGIPLVTSAGATFSPDAAPWRCQGMVADDGVWQYYGSCEYIAGAGVQTTAVDNGFDVQPTTTIMAPMTTVPVATTTTTPLVDPTALAEQVLVVDATGGEGSISEVVSLLGATPKHAAVATRPVDETMVMPIGTDATAAFVLLERFGVGGFDTWTPDLVAGPLPEGVTVVLVIGRYGPQGWTP